MALIDAKSASAKKEGLSAKDAFSRVREQAVEDYKKFEGFKIEILKGGYASYCVGYEDGRDAVEKLYLDLDLSSVTAPDSK